MMNKCLIISLAMTFQLLAVIGDDSRKQERFQEFIFHCDITVQRLTFNGR